MLLDRIDIEAHGPLRRVELGPFAEHLNVICGPDGSGKTAIVRFVRDSLVGREYPLGMLSSSTGRVVWADRNGLVHCRREKDGSAKGRQSVEFESRGDYSNRFGSLGHSWLAGISSSKDSRRATEALKLPESIVDGVITDTGITSVARVVSACVRSGLDSPDFYASLPAAEGSIYNRRDGYTPCGDDTIAHDDRHSEHHRRLRAKLADIDAELARLNQVQSIDSVGFDPYRSPHNDGDDHAYSEYQSLEAHPQRHHRLLQLHDRARELRARQNEHRRWIAEIDHDLSRSGGHYLNRWRSSDHRIDASISDERLRRRLDDLDAQMIHWRRALSEVRGLSQAILDGNPSRAPLPTYDEASLRRMRLDGFLHAIDRYEYSNSWDDFYPDRYRPLYEIDDIDYRIDSATRHIDWLLDRYATADHGHYDWYQSRPAAVNHRAKVDLQDALRAVRDDLRHLQRHALNRHRAGQHTIERHATHYSDSFSSGRGYYPRTERHGVFSSGTVNTGAVNTSRDLVELRRNEDWIVEAMKQLNRHREQLLRDSSSALNTEIADLARDNEYDLYILDRDRRENVAQLGRINAELDACLQEAARVRRSMRSLPIVDSRWYDDHRHVGNRPLAGDPTHGHTRDVRFRQDRIGLLERRRAELVRQLDSAHAHPAATAPRSSRSPLADAASRWLVRLSGGRLTCVEWPHNLFRGNATGYHAGVDTPTGIQINGRDESECAAADRALAVIAVRLAAGELLGRSGRHVPIVVETHSEILSRNGAEYMPTSNYDPNAYFDTNPYSYTDGDYHGINTVVAALRDYARAGRQIVMLTSNSHIASQMSRIGARSYEIHPERILHPHRPMWKSQYRPESYVGPHAHTYGQHDADEIVGYDRPLASSGGDVNRDFDVAWREAYGLYGSYLNDHHRNQTHGAPSTGYGQYQTQPDPRSLNRTDWARDGAPHRDGYYFAESYTTDDPRADTVPPATDRNFVKSPVNQKPVSPFFLSVDSPIDQAPSIDAVAAARLRGLKVTHINHLMQHDPNRLSDALGLANVDAATIRRWQAECRLVCRVPQLRGFDARVLVGVGIATPAQLSAIHPVDLLQDVEAFLATDRGQKILLSGSSQELSRITSWIAAANATDGEIASFGGKRNGNRDFDPRSRQRYGRRYDTADHRDFDSDPDEYEQVDGAGSNVDGRSRRRRITRSSSRGDGYASRDGNGNGRARRNGSRSTRRSGGQGDGIVRGNRDRSGGGDGRGTPVGGQGNGLRNGTGRGSGSNNRSGRSQGGGQRYRDGRVNRNGSGRGYGDENGNSRSSRRRRSNSSPRDVVRYEGASAEYADREYEPDEYQEREPRRSFERDPRESGQRAERESSQYVEQPSSEDSGPDSSELELRFYLQREDPVVDAPSIGARMAERLNAIGIHTVDDLLSADPETVANELDTKRVDADTVLQWQQQSTLVCRVPMLRGHDAQLLVAAEVTTPEELAEFDPSELLEIIDPISNSSEGKRIIRGGKLPDLEEVTDWVNFGQQHRELRAA